MSERWAPSDLHNLSFTQDTTSRMHCIELIVFTVIIDIADRHTGFIVIMRSIHGQRLLPCHLMRTDRKGVPSSRHLRPSDQFKVGHGCNRLI